MEPLNFLRDPGNATRARVISRTCLLLVTATLSCTISAQELGIRNRYVERLDSTRNVAALTTDAFGDQLNLQNGSVVFDVVDIDIPGNSTLPVQLRRRLVIEDQTNGTESLGSLGGREFDVPYLSGTFEENSGWRVGSTESDQRCSVVAGPPSKGQFSANEYWHGYSMHIPGSGTQALLSNPAAGLPAPTGSTPYPWITRNFWRLGCLAQTKNAYPGQGFFALAPDGTKYTFDWVVTRSASDMRKGFAGGGVSGTYRIHRKVVLILATRIEDRFGNSVDYTYDGTGSLQKIQSSDGRQIVLTKSGSTTTAASNLGTWSYNETANGATVTQPDGAQWKYAWSGGLRIDPADEPMLYDTSNTCPPSVISSGALVYAVTHPSGMTSEFQFQVSRHYRYNIPRTCVTYTQVGGGGPEGLVTYTYLRLPNFADSLTLTKKTISGPGLGPMVWSYAYGKGGLFNGFEDVCANANGPTDPQCPLTVATEVIGPGKFERYRFGARYDVNEGQLIQKESGPDADHILETKSHAYLDPVVSGTQAFPNEVGDDLVQFGDHLNNMRLRPQSSTSIMRDGATFSMQVKTGCAGGTHCFDVFARPLSVSRASSLGYSRTESNAYYDNLSKWVLGQTAKTTIDGIVASETGYDTLARPVTQKFFGKLQQTLTYNADGTIATVKDGNAKVTSLSNWKRGIPQTIVHPVAPGAPAETETAVVNDDGTLASIKDEAGYSTGYTYDPMGRLSKITYPTGDSVAWNATTLNFSVQAGKYGLPNHWRQLVATGNGYTITRYDALWRPVIEETYDNASTAIADATRSLVVKRYDAAGRLEFQSYPVRTLTNWADTTLKGTHTTYDALDRPLLVKQDSELGVLTTQTEYLSGFQTRVTNPRGYSTTAKYLAYDQPTTDYPLVITHPEGAYTYIGRDVFGKPTYVVRRNGPGDVAVRRTFVYDANQQLCKTIEPETDATVMAYDAAGNLAWSAGGLPFVSTTDCNTANVAIASRITRSYDARNRLQSLVFPDHRGDTTYTYTPDGQPASLIADNGGGNLVTTTYTYNRRRLLTGERMVLGGVDQPITYGYDANGHLASQIYPTGGSIAFAPNALGQPTQAGTYATNVTYHPNGAVARFVYGNGIVHTLQQNDRQLPERSKDAYGTTVVALDDSYDYDKNGNVAGISDALPENRGNRTMSYDGLDRLTQATSPMFGVGGAPTSANYDYDVVDNLTHVKVLSANQPRDHYYCYDSHWRLDFIRTGPNCSGSTSPAAHALNYDVQGNLAGKDNATFDFDNGNRLRSAQTAGGTTTYVYDGLGRRVRDVTGASKYSQYSRSGELVYANDLRTNKRVINVYLAGSLVSELEYDVPSAVWTTRYMHTDALGSVVARSSAGRSSVIRTEYEPFGAMINRVNYDRPAYAGHVMDAATGLTYMQQRYYDPGIGRFLSVDPVTADGSTGGNFNRYWYANNNPYRFVDPDGRCTGSHIENKDGTCPGGGFTTASGGPSQRPQGGLFTQGSLADQMFSLPGVGESLSSWFSRTQCGGDCSGIFTEEFLPAIPMEGQAFSAGKVVAGGGLMAFRIGRAGEDAVRSAYNIGGRGYFFVNGRLRISDGLNWSSRTLSEVKNTQSLSFTRQLRDYADYARANRLQFNLFVRPGAQLSGPLLQAAAAGQMIIREIPLP